ncbi:MAG: ribonucleoside-diphosphate reductase subunit alpha, partial [Clostridiales bacterium]|nr:ribonucleoside-diphosphate reductase subunit alpha [Clostridiales bacterium]
MNEHINTAAKYISQAFDDQQQHEVCRKIFILLENISKHFPDGSYSLERLQKKFDSFKIPGMSIDEKLSALTKAAVELTSQEAPQWENIAARLLSFDFHRRLAREEKSRNIKDFYEKICYLTHHGLYGPYILDGYSKTELNQAHSFLRPERNDLFTFAGLELLLKRYVITGHDHTPLESPQEMFLGIALHLALKEEKQRMDW